MGQHGDGGDGNTHFVHKFRGSDTLLGYKAKAAAKPKALADNANRKRFRPQPRGLPSRPIENWFRLKPDSYVMLDSDGAVHCVADADGVTVF